MSSYSTLISSSYATLTSSSYATLISSSYATLISSSYATRISSRIKMDTIRILRPDERFRTDDFVRRTWPRRIT